MAARDVEGLRVPFRFSNPDKVFFPATADHPAYTKADVAAYYDAVADILLPHLRGRPMVMRRYPNGINAGSFFHKDYAAQAPPFVRKQQVWSEQQQEVYDYVVVDNRDTLLWLVQLGCIEMHPWLSRVGDCPECCADPQGIDEPPCGLEHPDLLVVDCDPYVRQGRLGSRPREAGGEPGISREDFEAASRVGLLLRDTLRSLGIRSYPKTSGKRGLHVYVPIEPRHTYEEVRAVAKQLGAHLAADHPRLITLEYAKEKRAGRVFFDYNQNVRGKTLASPWSVRPTPEASVAMPLLWDEVEGADPASWTIANVPETIRGRGDPWGEFRSQDLGGALASRDDS